MAGAKTATREGVSGRSGGLAQHPVKVNSLVSLPYDYSELINSTSGFTCPRSLSDDARVPAMCLVCGQIKPQTSGKRSLIDMLDGTWLFGDPSGLAGARSANWRSPCMFKAFKAGVPRVVTNSS